MAFVKTPYSSQNVKSASIYQMKICALLNKVKTKNKWGVGPWGINVCQVALKHASVWCCRVLCLGGGSTGLTKGVGPLFSE